MGSVYFFTIFKKLWILTSSVSIVLTSSRSSFTEFQVGLFLLIPRRHFDKSFRRELAYNVILIKPLDDRIQFKNPPLLFFKLALGLLLFGHPCINLFRMTRRTNCILIILDISHHPL